MIFVVSGFYFKNCVKFWVIFYWLFYFLFYIGNIVIVNCVFLVIKLISKSSFGDIIDFMYLFILNEFVSSDVLFLYIYVCCVSGYRYVVV